MPPPPGVHPVVWGYMMGHLIGAPIIAVCALIPGRLGLAWRFGLMAWAMTVLMLALMFRKRSS